METHMIQGTPEWLEFRSTRIGASDSAKILGLSPYGSAFDLYLEKTGQKESNFNPAMSYGNRMEPLVRAYYEEKVGEWFPPAVVTHPDYDWLIASLDGISSDNKRILEIKTCNAQVFEDAQRGEIPKYYYCQAQHQLFCTPKARDVEFVFYHKGNYCHVIITPDDDFVSDMIPRLLEFYENCIVNRLPPSMSDNE
jgi:putative phage-type endonuclease